MRGMGIPFNPASANPNDIQLALTNAKNFLGSAKDAASEGLVQNATASPQEILGTASGGAWNALHNLPEKVVPRVNGVQVPGSSSMGSDIGEAYKGGADLANSIGDNVPEGADSQFAMRHALGKAADYKKMVNAAGALNPDTGQAFQENLSVGSSRVE